MGIIVVAFFAASVGPSPVVHDQINTETNQLRRKLTHAIILLLGKSIFNADIFPLNPAKLPQLLPEHVHVDRATRSIAWIQETDAKDFVFLLRVDGTAKHKEQSTQGKS